MDDLNTVTLQYEYSIDTGRTLDDALAAQAQAERKKSQLVGIEFQGVMCSAVKEDQDGLDAVQGQFLQFVMARDVILPAKINAATGSEKAALQLQRDAMVFPTINFRFENGTILPLNDGNIEALSSVWQPFRMSFFPPENAA